MSYATFQCQSKRNPALKYSAECTVMIRCKVDRLSQESRICKWCRERTAYYADGSLKRRTMEEQHATAPSQKPVTSPVSS